MGEQRTNLFAGEEVLDLAEFTPKKPTRQDMAVAKQAAAVTGFTSREPKAIAPVAVVKPPQRRRRTGRNVQINLKAKAETIEEFYALADAHGWVLGEALERAVELLREKYGAKKQ